MSIIIIIISISIITIIVTMFTIVIIIFISIISSNMIAVSDDIIDRSRLTLPIYDSYNDRTGRTCSDKHKQTIMLIVTVRTYYYYY